MKQFLILILLSLPFAFLGQNVEYVYPETSYSEGNANAPILVNFHNGNLSSAIAKAKREAKLVFVDFYADWCGPCKLIEQEVFTDRQFADYINTNFVTVKLDIDGIEGIDFSSKMNVSSYPTALIINTKESEIGRITGYKTLNSYFLELRRLEAYSAYQR